MSRPVLRYHGGKWRLAPWIISYFPPHRVYVEPYGGAASVLMQKPRVNGELINDLDGELVNVFRVLREPDQGLELARRLRLTPYSRTEYEDSHLPGGDRIEQARKTIYRSFAGFGSDSMTATNASGFRDNLTRGNGIPATDWANYPCAIQEMIERLSGVVIESRPAIQIIVKHDTPETLFYVDPPYPHATRAGHVKRKHSYRHEMTDADHIELASVLKSVRGMVILSGYTCDLYNGLYGDWMRAERCTYADAAQKRTEVLWINKAAAKGMNQASLFAE